MNLVHQAAVKILVIVVLMVGVRFGVRRRKSRDMMEPKIGSDMSLSTTTWALRLAYKLYREVLVQDLGQTFEGD